MISVRYSLNLVPLVQMPGDPPMLEFSVSSDGGDRVGIGSSLGGAVSVGDLRFVLRQINEIRLHNEQTSHPVQASEPGEAEL